MSLPTELSLPAMQAWIDSHDSQWLKEYQTFLSFPSISSEPAYQADLLACQAWIMNELKKMNFLVESWPTSGHPVIYAHYSVSPSLPTLLIYNHYDVQPVDPLDLWLSPPFEPTEREGEIYARGAQDNKGQCFYVLQALKLLIDQTGTLPLNVKLCIEGEEEIGSAGLSKILDQKRKALKADYLAVVDMGLREAHQPALTLGIRGIVTFDVTLEGSKTDLHSGSHGGIVPNPLHALVQLLAGLKDDQGQVTIPHFYSQVKPLSPAEQQHISLDFDSTKYTEQTGAIPVGGEKNFSPLARAWMRPTLEINGLWGGYQGTGFKTVIPAQAHAKLSCRLVAQQKPAQIAELVSNYLKSQAPVGVNVSVIVHPGVGEAVHVSPNSYLVQMFAQALTEVYGRPCEYILAGGSIPVVSQLTQAAGGDMILLGLGLDSDQIHAPNEHFGIDRLKKGMLMMARAMQLLSKKDTSHR